MTITIHRLTDIDRYSRQWLFVSMQSDIACCVSDLRLASTYYSQSCHRQAVVVHLAAAAAAAALPRRLSCNLPGSQRTPRADSSLADISYRLQPLSSESSSSSAVTSDVARGERRQLQRQKRLIIASHNQPCLLITASRSCLHTQI